ncbi:MAG: hypothetical protein PHO06_02720 [Clostridia bacterium]|jgi:hypothetical protein|nr:hypothetical protein [Clostridia bacterium]
MKIGKTESVLPLVTGLVGGIVGIFGGACATFCADLVSALGAGSILTTICAYGGLIVAIIGLILGCLAKTTNRSTLLLTICGFVMAIFVVLLMVDGYGFNWMFTTSAVLFIVGGFVGMKETN